MSKIVEVSGSLTVQSDTCVSGQTSDAINVSLGPGGCCSGKKYYQAIIRQQLELATTGLVGTNFEDLDVVADLTQVELLYIKSTAEVAVRLYAIAASIQAVSGVFPTGFGGGETLITTIDGVPVTTTFDVADQTAAQCAARINAAMALAGIATPRASVVSGQILITGVETAVGSSGIGQISCTGTGAAQLGLDSGSSPTTVDAQGKDVHVNGLSIFEFPTTGSNLLTAIEISGVATIDVLAAGRSQ
jgi:hypothetical protein